MSQYKVKFETKNDFLIIEDDHVTCYGNDQQYFTISLNKMLAVTPLKKKIILNWLEPDADGDGMEEVYGQSIETKYVTKIKNEIEAEKMKKGKKR